MVWTLEWVWLLLLLFVAVVLVFFDLVCEKESLALRVGIPGEVGVEIPHKSPLSLINKSGDGW